MPRKKACNLGKTLAPRSLVRFGHLETLGDLDQSFGSDRSEYHDLVRNVRDGAQEQRCGGGTRLIRKRPSE